MLRKPKPSGEPAPVWWTALTARAQAAWAFLRSWLSPLGARLRQGLSGVRLPLPKIGLGPRFAGLRERFAGVGRWVTGVGQWATGVRQWSTTAPATYAAPLMRVLRQAPWRSQTQLTAVWAITLLIVAVVGGLYLSVASRAATAGRDVQTLEERKGELERQNDEMRAELALLRAVPNLAARAQMLGFQPAAPDQVEYLRVTPITSGPVTVPQSNSQESAPTLTQWLAEALTGLLPQWHW